MARKRFETAPTITIFDESAVFKAAAGATSPVLAEFQNSSGTAVASISPSRKRFRFW